MRILTACLLALIFCITPIQTQWQQRPIVTISYAEAGVAKKFLAGVVIYNAARYAGSTVGRIAINKLKKALRDPAIYKAASKVIIAKLGRYVHENPALLENARKVMKQLSLPLSELDNAIALAKKEQEVIGDLLQGSKEVPIKGRGKR